jgi:hypothetical protein
MLGGRCNSVDQDSVAHRYPDLRHIRQLLGCSQPLGT